MKNTSAAVTTYTHILHFRDNEAMGYAAYRIDVFVPFADDVTENEFDGDDLYEVVFTTIKPVSKAAQAKMIKHFDPKDYTFNTQSR